MPCGDVPGRVHVSVAGVSAEPAGEIGLALARLAVHGPARAAALRGERGIDLLHPAGALLLQSPDQQAPAAGADAPVESGFLPDVAAGLLSGTPGGPGHASDAQVLNADHVEPAGQGSGGLLGPVLAPVSLTCLQPGDGQPHPPAASRPAPSAGQAPLQPHQLHLLGLAGALVSESLTPGR